MSDGDIRELSDEDRKLCRKASADSETGTESLLEPQDGGDDDLADSDLYDTDVETLATEEVSGRRISVEADCVETYLTTCEQDKIAPQLAIVRGLNEQEVNVRHRYLGDQDAHALLAALCKNSTVTHLQLAGNNIGALGTVYLKTVLTLNQHISYLDLSENDLGRDTSSSLAIADALRVNTGIRTLLLAQNNLRDQDAAYLAAGISANSHLVCLDLSRNLIAETGGVHIGRALAINNSIEDLNLSNNCIRQRGAVAICNGLQENGYASKLDVSWNGFSYEGSLAVCELLKKNSTLTELNLSSNRIDWLSIRLIAKGLASNKSLEALKLDNNPLTTTGCMDLIDAISNNQQSAIINLSLKEVSVVSDFELVTMMIKHARPEFTCQHGPVVNSPDVVGQRHEKRVTPIEKVIQFMKDHEYRTAEFFRILDKDGSRTLSSDELSARMLKLGIRLNRYEVEELMDFLQSNIDNQSSAIDYQQDCVTVDGLQPGLLEEDKAALLAQLKGGAKVVTPVPSTTGSGNTKTGKVGLMSMSTSLGSKAVPFGHSAAGGKKGKKTKKKKKNTKNKPSKAKNYDDEGVGLPA